MSQVKSEGSLNVTTSNMETHRLAVCFTAGLELQTNRALTFKFVDS